MTNRQLNTLLFSFAALLSCAAVAAVALAIAIPLQSDRSIRAATTQPAPSAADFSSPELAAFEPIFQKPLRQSLTDVPTSVPSESAAPGGFQLTLAGPIGNS